MSARAQSHVLWLVLTVASPSLAVIRWRIPGRAPPAWSASPARSRPPQLQLAHKLGAPAGGGTSGLLFQDSQKAVTARAEKERVILEPHTREMKPSRRRAAKARGGARGSGGGGFGKHAASAPPARTGAQQATALQTETLSSEGVALVPKVLGRDSAQDLLGCVADELARSYAAVDADPASSLARFNVPVETFDPLRGYLLLPLRDEASVLAGDASGPLVRGLRELLAPGTALGELFWATCGGRTAELYDLVALRTEPGAARQAIHSDTPYQKLPGLFCAFIALQDVSYEMGSTVFLPGTHTGPKGARGAFDSGTFDDRRDDMLSRAQSRYTMLRAGDAVFFNMNTLHAGTSNLAAECGGAQRLLLVLTFRNPEATSIELGHQPNLRPGYRGRGITLADVRAELGTDAPFAGAHASGAYGDGLQ